MQSLRPSQSPAVVRRRLGDTLAFIAVGIAGIVAAAKTAALHPQGIAKRPGVFVAAIVGLVVSPLAAKVVLYAAVSICMGVVLSPLLHLPRRDTHGHSIPGTRMSWGKPMVIVAAYMLLLGGVAAARPEIFLSWGTTLVTGLFAILFVSVATGIAGVNVRAYPIWTWIVVVLFSGLVMYDTASTVHRATYSPTFAAPDAALSLVLDGANLTLAVQ